MNGGGGRKTCARLSISNNLLTRYAAQSSSSLYCTLYPFFWRGERGRNECVKGGKIFMKIGVEETFFPLSSFLGGEEKHWHMCESGFSTFQGPPWERGSRFPHTHSALSTCSIFFFFFFNSAIPPLPQKLKSLYPGTHKLC